MGLTVHNANTLSLLNIINRTSQDQTTSLLRLSTGSKINRAADNPAGLIAVQDLSAELRAVESAINNGQRADSMLSVADGAFKEVSSLLLEIESLASASTSSGGLSASEIAANQSQIDSAINSIDRIIRTTSFNGKKLLDGQQSIRATASAPTEVTDVKIFSRPSSTSSQTFAVNVTTAGAVASATIANTSSVSAAQFSVAGKLGTATITVAAGEALTSIRDKIIASVGETGVSASVSGTELHIQSREYGESAFVSSNYISGDADFLTTAYTAGTDAVLTVNGENAYADGLKISFSSNGTSGSFTLTTAGNVAGSAGNVVISGGGATFQLGTDSSTRATVGIAPLFSHQLGDSVTGYLNTIKGGGTNDLNTNANNAVAITKAAINQVATAQGRVGGFQKFQVQTSINTLTATKEGLATARSVIQDVDFAAETSELSRQQVLLQSAISLLGVASQQSAQILSLLR